MRGKVTFDTRVTVEASGHNEATLIGNAEQKVRKQYGSKPIRLEGVEFEEIKGAERGHLHAALVEMDQARTRLHALEEDVHYAQLYKRLTAIADEVYELLFGKSR